jgi:hypothetical protein
VPYGPLNEWIGNLLERFELEEPAS